MITLRAVELRDLAPLAETLPRGFHNTTRETWLQRFENWWARNPAFTPEFPRGWILEEDGNIVGFIGNVPVKFVIQGEMGIAVASASWYADPTVRGMHSIRLFKEYLKQRNVDLFLFWNDNRDLLKVVGKSGFIEYPCQSQPSEYLYIIDRMQFIRRKNLKFILGKYLQAGDIHNVKVSSEILKKMGTFTYSYIFQMRPNRIKDSSEGMYTSSLCASCDDSFTRLWDPYLHPFDIAMSRDEATLNWLYFIAGRRYNRKVIQCRRSSDNSLVGYMVFDFLPWHASGGGAMQLMDMCIMNNHQQVLASLISYAIELGTENRAPFLLLWANSPDADCSLRRRFRIQWPGEDFSYVKFSETLERNSDSLHLYSCMMNPPRGIDH